MPTPERRQHPRTKVERLAYIQIEPDNGGIVLNVSEEGLCFHSIAPVEGNGQMRFFLLEQNRRIDARGELAWTDEIHKVAGLRFTTLTTEAREQVHAWMTQPEAPRDERNNSTLGSAILRTIPALGARRSKPQPETRKAAFQAANLLKLRLRLRFTGFSAGVLTGVVVSVLAISVFLFSYAHRRQLGESLIHFGERLAARTVPTAAAPSEPAASQQTPASARHQVAALPAASVKLPAKIQTPARVNNRDSWDGPDVIQIPIASSRPHPEAPNTSATSATAMHAASAPALQHAASAVADVAPAAASAVTATLPASQPSAANRVANNAGTTDASAPPEMVHIVNTGTHTGELLGEMYFDIGKFKDELLARSVRDKIEKLGLRATVAQKGHLWMNSYQVLVGPITDEDEASRAHRTLLAQGYRPRPFERGSRNFSFSSRVSLNGTRLPTGDVTIRWESFVRNAKVRVVQGDEVVATADGHWIAAPRRYSQDEYVYLRTADGSKPLLEVHFSGSSRILVFRKVS